MASVSLREKIASIEEHRRNNELSILRLSEPLITDYTQHPDSSKRASDASAAAYDTPSPASLETDLVHYKVIEHLRVLGMTLTGCPGAVLQTPVLLSGTSHERKVPTRHRRGSTTSRRACGEC